MARSRRLCRCRNLSQPSSRSRRRLLDPFDERRVVHLLTGASTAWHEEQIGLRTVGESVVQIDAEATTSQDRACLLRYSEDGEGRRVGEAVGDGEDFERAAE